MKLHPNIEDRRNEVPMWDTGRLFDSEPLANRIWPRDTGASYWDQLPLGADASYSDLAKQAGENDLAKAMQLQMIKMLISGAIRPDEIKKAQGQ